MELRFRSYEILIDGYYPTLQDFQTLCAKGNIIFTFEDFTYEIEHEVDQHNECYWLSAAFEKTKLYSPEVWDQAKGQREQNPRRNKTPIFCILLLEVSYSLFVKHK